MQLSVRPFKSLRTRSLLAVVTLIVVLTYPLAFACARDFRPLDPLDETKVQPVPTFVAAEAFKIGSSIGGRTLSAVGLNFAAHFVRVAEQNVPAASLKAWTLLYTIGDRPLIEALGGEKHAGLHSLASIHRIMEMGDEGPSHTDGRSNFAYLRSPVDRKLWAVHWFVNDVNEWVIGAVQVRIRSWIGGQGRVSSLRRQALRPMTSPARSRTAGGFVMPSALPEWRGSTIGHTWPGKHS